MSRADTDGTYWKRRWDVACTDLARLQTELDHVSAELAAARALQVEAFEGENGIERAKTHRIKQQSSMIRRLQAQMADTRAITAAEVVADVAAQMRARKALGPAVLDEIAARRGGAA